MTLKMILAADLNDAIGYKGISTLPWYIPEDLKNFKNLTKGQSLVMGYNTFKSLPVLLPNRTHFVVSRYRSDKIEQIDDVLVSCGRIEEAVKKATETGKEVFVIGGAQVYEYCLERGMIDEIYLTRVLTKLKGNNLATVALSRYLSEFELVACSSSGDKVCNFYYYSS